MLCPKCGKSVENFFIFCPHCGYSLMKKTNEEFKLISKENNELSPSYGLIKINIFLLIILIFITLGFFCFIWFFMQMPALNRMNSDRKIGKKGFYLCFPFYFASFFLPFIGIVDGIFFLVMYFKVLSILDDHFNKHLKMNINFSPAGVLFLGILYLQYKINKL